MTRPASPFVWQAPTRMRCGPHALDGIGEEAAALGSCALVLVDVRARTNPVVGRALSALTEHGVSTPWSWGPTGVPTLGQVRSVAAAAAAHRANMLVGIGGGSVMDLTKLVALGLTNPGLLAPATWDAGGVVDRYDDASVVPGLPTLLVPTTAATGSEVNTVAALQHRGQRRLLVCGALAPASAVLDPRVLGSLPDHLLLQGVLETLARVLGPYVADSRQGRDTTDRVSEALCHQALTLGDRVAAGRRTPATDADVQWLTTVSGTHLATVGRPSWSHTLWYVQDTIGTVAGVPKGPAIAAVLPAYLRAVVSGHGLGAHLGDADRLRALVGAVVPLLGRSADSAAASAYAMVRRWGLPGCLTELGLTAGNGGVQRLSRLAHDRWSGAGPFDNATPGDFSTFFASAVEAPVRAPAAATDLTASAPRPPVTPVPGAQIETRREVNA